MKAPISYDGARISQERNRLGVRRHPPDLGGIKGGLNYDLYNAKFANIYASVDAYLTRKLTLSLDYDY